MVELNSPTLIIAIKRELMRYFKLIKRRIKKIKFLCSEKIIVRNALDGVSISEAITVQRSIL
jgi:hypothetical protein